MFTELARILAYPGGSANYQTLHGSVSRLWLRPPESHTVVDLYSLSVILPILSFTVTIYCYRLVLYYCWPVLVKYQDSTSRQSVNTNRLYLEANRPLVNITNLIWTLPVKTGSLPVFNRRAGNILAGQAGNT